ncbi:MAG: outer membrane beta-barrel protein [Verrucomicrobiales bacterium]|nr:outer membrane beta-barrel protein [Verrucomicrobiales bacterium]
MALRSLPGVALSTIGLAAHAEWDAEKYLVYGFGQVSLRPQLEIGETYDSNIFYAEEDVVGDFVLSLRPGLSLVYGQKSDNYVSIRYTLDASVYADRDDLNNLGHLFGHQSRIRLARWTIQGTDNFAYTRALLGGSFTYIQKRIGLMSLTDAWRADYELSSRMMIGTKFGFDWADYDAADLGTVHLYDFMAYNIGARVGYLPADKIVVFPEFTYGQAFLEENNPQAAAAPEVDSYSMAIGAEGEFTPKLSGMVSGGYEIRRYSDDSDIPDGWVADSRLRWQMRPKTTLTVGYRHFIQVSREARAIPFTAHRPMVSIEQELGTMGKWLAAVDASYQFNDYQGEFVDAGPPRRMVVREEDFLSTSLRVSWKWQPWLLVTTAYDFRKYSDNLSGVPNYDLHRLSLRFTAGY